MSQAADILARYATHPERRKALTRHAGILRGCDPEVAAAILRTLKGERRRELVRARWRR